MQYENHIPPEGINTQDESSLKELFILIGGIVLLVVGSIALLHFFMSTIANKIPYAYEEKISTFVVADMIDEDQSEEDLKVEEYLQTLADELSKNMQLPEEMSITVHYSSADTVNAFATLGGHVFMYKGLLEKLPNENALSMVMAHEIAHIKHRHPIVSMGEGLTLAAAIGAIGAVSSDNVATAIAGIANINTMGFSREQETQSDHSGLIALEKKYAHTEGADGLFKVFQSLEDEDGSPSEFFSTHPLSENRVDNISKWTLENDWQANGKTTPIPKNIARYLKQDSL